MTEKEKAIVVLMAIATLLGHINIQESTRNMNRLLGSIRKGLTRLFNAQPKVYAELVHKANDIWSSVAVKEKDIERTIVIEETIIALYGLIENNQYKNMWFTDKAFNKAIGSYYDYVKRNGTVEKTQHDSNVMVDEFQEVLGLSKKSKLSSIKKNIYNHLVLEGKIK